ncbi:MAG: periplasmic heavy metal sensor [Planctomycetota bacterium]|jgi:Spy/CpxP family protein refolding chaperone
MRAIRSRLVWLALAISVLFNVFFLAGYLQARAGVVDGGSGAPVQRVTEELGLNDAQATLFRQLRDGMAQDEQMHRRRFELAREELMEELNKPEPDVARLREIVDREAELHRERYLAGSRRFSHFVGVLSPEQRRRLSDHFQHHRRGRGRGDKEWMLRRFDANEDGHLDEQERAAAREHFEERKRQRHAEMLERFDADGDGQLDESELEEARRWFQQNGRDGGGRRGRRR